MILALLAATTWIVAPESRFATIESALAQAQAGDRIEVQTGRYRGPLVVDKSVELVGIDWPIIDGGEVGTVVTLSAAGTRFSGFVVQGSGRDPDRDHSGIIVSGAGSTVSNNRLREVLFGVFVSAAADSLIEGNDITGKAALDLGRKGDAIRLWYSPRVVVRNNTVRAARDVVAWYSQDVRIENNRIVDGRYGIHLMYDDGVEVRGNQLRHNSVGIYVMYSRRVEISGNDVRHHRGPSGYGLGLKDTDDVTITDNVLVDNRAGMFIDGTPFTRGRALSVKRNLVAFNEEGMMLFPSVQDGLFEANTFWENGAQVALDRGQKSGCRWSGNFWSDQLSVDADGDGLAELPYHAEHTFEGLIDREPALRMLRYSPAAQALEMAGAMFPVVRPKAKLTDEHPAAEPLPIVVESAVAAGGASLSLAAAVLLATTALLVSFGIGAFRIEAPR